ncbi:helix-turn-helix domain-containing protein [Ellagibacter isourolithinifaciens]
MKRKKDLAAASGLTQAVINHCVKGTRVLNLETAIRISSALCKPIAVRSA